jgi:dihydroorotase-like cyclic amidohydrolase
MARRALISKHIVLTTQPHSSRPTYGIILIEGELIHDVVIIESSIPVSSVMSKYESWNPENLENLYISPGIIDLNTRLEFETCTELTKAALSGGATFVLLESGYYNDTVITGESFCDVGKVATLEISTIDSIGFLKEQGYFAIKGYLYPPHMTVQCIPANLLPVLQEVEKTGLPLILDPNLPDPRQHHMVSPFRLRPLKDRLQAGHKETQSFSAAFPDLIEEEEEESPVPKINVRRSMAVDIGKKEKQVKDERSNSFEGEKTNVRKTTELFLDIDEIKEEDEDFNRLKQLRKANNPLFDDLDKRIKQSQMSITNISLAEIESYKKSGVTHFASPSGLLPNPLNFPISPISDASSATNSVPSSPKPSLLQRRKLAGSLSLVVNHPDTPKEQLYCYHMANYSQTWEMAGINKLIEALKKSSCRVHICNISSASSINRIRQAKEWTKRLTCEIPATHLSFSSMSIGESDTRFKSHPPIRNQANTNLLWDLLKLKGIDVISSGHASVHPNFKLTKGDFQKAANGLPCIGFSLLAVWTTLNGPASSYSHLDHYIVRLAKWLSLYPAEVLNIASTRGSISKGKFADLVIWNPFEKQTISQDFSPFPECSPFIGSELYGKIFQVYLRGNLAYDQGRLKQRGRVVYRLSSS